jgi:8-oxo-dGTP diphosphatase
MKSSKQVRVGIGVFVFKNGKFIMLKRQGAHGEGTWSIPGGHLEYGESFEDTAKREIFEETGMQIHNVRFGAVTNDYFKKEDKHYVTVWVLSDWQSGEARNMEPDKCTEIKWKTFSSLLENLFLPWKQLLKSEFYDSIKPLAA